MNVDSSVNAVSSGIRLFAGTTTASGGRGRQRASGASSTFELLDEDIEEKFVKASSQ